MNLHTNLDLTNEIVFWVKRDNIKVLKSIIVGKMKMKLLASKKQKRKLSIRKIMKKDIF